jgi:NADP+-dependent farnesol dehydrogenase
MVDKWVGKTAVVTGASAGIGAAIFKDFARAGVNVVGLARRSEKIEDLIKELGPTKGKTFAYKCDVSDPKSVTNTFKWLEDKFGVVNILVNNAGIGRNVAILDDKEESFKKINEVIDTNLRGLVQCTREAFRLMKKSDDYGLIININSILGHYIPFMGMTMNVYPASKYAVTAISETIRQELVISDNKKVRVTVIFNQA